MLRKSQERKYKVKEKVSLGAPGWLHLDHHGLWITLNAQIEGGLVARDESHRLAPTRRAGQAFRSCPTTVMHISPSFTGCYYPSGG